MPRGVKDAKPAKAKVDAELAAARKSPKKEASTRRQIEKRLAEAQERQTAREVHAGGGRVGITARHRDGRVEIAVSDTGIGIAPEDQAAIFEEFRQAGRNDARKQEGTGLGLTLAKKFVELHGGQIWVRSQVGQGSTFTFTLPVRSERTSSSE